MRFWEGMNTCQGSLMGQTSFHIFHSEYELFPSDRHTGNNKGTALESKTISPLKDNKVHYTYLQHLTTCRFSL